MGSALIKRVLANGCDVSVYNRTRAKAEALVEFGAKVVDSPADLADREVNDVLVEAGPSLSGHLLASGLVDDDGDMWPTVAQVREIAEAKMKDLNANDVEGAMQIILGSAKSMGIEVK